MSKRYAIGLDYGSLSCRGVLACTDGGAILAEEEYVYPHGILSDALPDGTKLPPLWAVQHPQDYLDALARIIPALLQSSGVPPEAVAALGIDTTASTVVAVDGNLTPLCRKEGFAREIHAWPKMWKHHAAWREAEELTASIRERTPALLERYGGGVGAESMLPKLLQTLREAPGIFEAGTFFECGDWLVSLLAGREVRSGSYLTCKSLWDPALGYPKGPLFEPLTEKLPPRGGAVLAWPGQSVGTLSPEMARKLGLSPRTVLSAPQMDAYAGLPGCGVSGPGVMAMVLGTSNACLLLGRESRPVSGICAAIPDSILLGFTGYAAGQPCTGDMLRWFTENCVPAACERAARESGRGLHAYLTGLAEKKRPGESGLIALDWWNGNKSVLNDPGLSGVLLGMTLATRPEDIYRALIESAAYGTRKILDTFRRAGAEVSSIIASGGGAAKNPMLMQIYADVLNMPVAVSACTQAAALGSAMYAAAAAGEYDSAAGAAAAMSQGTASRYLPRKEAAGVYGRLYAEYEAVHDYFGRGENRGMARLRAIAREAAAHAGGSSPEHEEEKENEGVFPAI